MKYNLMASVRGTQKRYLLRVVRKTPQAPRQTLREIARAIPLYLTSSSNTHRNRRLVEITVTLQYKCENRIVLRDEEIMKYNLMASVRVTQKRYLLRVVRKTPQATRQTLREIARAIPLYLTSSSNTHRNRRLVHMKTIAYKTTHTHTHICQIKFYSCTHPCGFIAIWVLSECAYCLVLVLLRF